MPIQVFPTPSAGASYSSQPPASASSVLLDGQLVTASSISTSVTGTGAPWLLYANGAGSTTVTIDNVPYTVPAGSTVGTSALTGAKYVSVEAAGAGTPTSFTASTMPSSVNWNSVAYGIGKFVSLNTGGSSAYSTNGTSWTASTMPSASAWNAITFGVGYFIAVANGPTTAGAYFAQPLGMPVNFGIYNGPTTIN